MALLTLMLSITLLAVEAMSYFVSFFILTTPDNTNGIAKYRADVYGIQSYINTTTQSLIPDHKTKHVDRE